MEREQARRSVHGNSSKRRIHGVGTLPSGSMDTTATRPSFSTTSEETNYHSPIFSGSWIDIQSELRSREAIDLSCHEILSSPPIAPHQMPSDTIEEKPWPNYSDESLWNGMLAGMDLLTPNQFEQSLDELLDLNPKKS